MLKREIKLLKGVARDSRRSLRDQRARVSAPVQSFLLRSLQYECIAPEYFFYCWPEKKLIFIEVPKCGSTFVLRTLAKARNGMDFEPANPHSQNQSKLPGIQQLGAEEFFDLARSPETHIFTVVRNPISRALSCYLDKFKNVTIGDGSYISNIVTYWWDHKGRDVPKGRPITFDEFTLLTEETAHIGFDGHWAQQSRIVPTQVLAPTHVCKFENLIDELGGVLREANVSAEVLDHLEKSRRKPTADLANSLLTDDIRARLASVYAGDFDRFGYDKTDHSFG